jgi:hypothetical protein
MLPHYEPPPKAGPAKKEYLYKQMLYQERHGGLVSKPHSPWCYQLHTVFKGARAMTTSTTTCAPRTMHRVSTDVPS